jgi:outer membrane protein assembly factor BamD
VSQLLAAHEWYVAEFYWKRGEAMGTVLRLRTLLKQYPDTGFEQRALYLLGRAYMKVGRPQDAKKSFQTLVERFPKDAHAGDARRALGKLGS